VEVAAPTLGNEQSLRGCAAIDSGGRGPNVAAVEGGANVGIDGDDPQRQTPVRVPAALKGGLAQKFIALVAQRADGHDAVGFNRG
jgi:hypothetical protein